MSLAERHPIAPTVSLASMLTGRRSALEGTTALTVSDYAADIVRSGSPLSDTHRSRPSYPARWLPTEAIENIAAFLNHHC